MYMKEEAHNVLINVRIKFFFFFCEWEQKLLMKTNEKKTNKTKDKTKCELWYSIHLDFILFYLKMDIALNWHTPIIINKHLFW